MAESFAVGDQKVCLAGLLYFGINQCKLFGTPTTAGKIDETVLALLYLTGFKDNDYLRAWKGHDWDSLNRLFEKGMISNPKSKSKSVVLTDEGAEASEKLFKSLFGVDQTQ